MPPLPADGPVALLRALRDVGLCRDAAPVAVALVLELDRLAIEAAEERRIRARQGGFARWGRADRAA
jgi:hypothetical protein